MPPAPPDPPAPPVERAHDARSRLRWDAAAAAVLAAMLALLLHGAARVGPTYDEHYYVASGVLYWKDGELALNREHPPLVKLLAALPLLPLELDYPEHAVDAVSYPVAFFYQREAENLERNLFLARLPICLLSVLGAYLVYAAGKRIFGAPAGLLGLALYAFHPTVLGHGRLVSLDAGLTPLFFGAVLAFLHLLELPAGSPRWGTRTLVAALAFGLANLAKSTALVLGPAFALLAFLRALEQRSPRPLGHLALVLLGGLGVFSAGYGFEARSRNEAWGRPEYVRAVEPEAVAPRDLAAALRADPPAGADAEAAELAALLAGASDLESAVRDLVAEVERAGDAPARAAAAARALAALEPGPGVLRSRAFAAVLEAGPALPPELRREVLAALSGRSCPDEPCWRRVLERAGAGNLDDRLLHLGWIRRLVRGIFGDERPVPLWSAVDGVDQQLAHGKFGHGTYFRGRVVSNEEMAEGNPFPEYFAVVLAVKSPLATLALFAAGVVLVFLPGRSGRSTRLRAAAFLGVPLAVFALFSAGKVLLGVRYLFPILPFLALLAGRVASLGRWPAAVGLVLAAVALAESAWIHPHQLMYANALAGGPDGATRITVVGDDWGQDVPAVGRFLARHREEIEAAGGLHYRPYTAGGPEAFGLEGIVGPTGPVEGIVAVHVVDLRREADEFGWLEDYEPFLVIGHAVRIYDTRGGPPGRNPVPEWRARRAGGD